MRGKLRIIGINGSASENSANLSILKWIRTYAESQFDLKIINPLSDLPHFKPERTENNVPERIIEFRNQVEKAEGIIICTPEYIFSIPSGLKNAFEWSVSTTVLQINPLDSSQRRPMEKEVMQN